MYTLKFVGQRWWTVYTEGRRKTLRQPTLLKLLADWICPELRSFCPAAATFRLLIWECALRLIWWLCLIWPRLRLNPRNKIGATCFSGSERRRRCCRPKSSVSSKSPIFLHQAAENFNVSLPQCPAHTDGDWKFGCEDSISIFELLLEFYVRHKFQKTNHW